MTDIPCKKELDDYNKADLYRRKIFKEIGLEVKNVNEKEMSEYIEGADLSHAKDQEKLRIALERLDKADKALDGCLKKHKDWS